MYHCQDYLVITTRFKVSNPDVQDRIRRFDEKMRIDWLIS